MEKMNFSISRKPQILKEAAFKDAKVGRVCAVRIAVQCK
jgi:hypothetical protein